MTSRSPAERRTVAMALPALPQADAAAVNAFLDAIWAENGLAQQTLDSYRRDLELLARWRDGRGGGLVAADRAALFDYLAWRAQQGYSPRSNARLLSALRAFYAWCVRRGTRSDDPTALLDPPKLPRSLPKALAESQIEALLAAPDIADAAGAARSRDARADVCRGLARERTGQPAIDRGQPAPGRAAGDGQGQQGAPGAAGRGGAALAGALPGKRATAAGGQTLAVVVVHRDDGAKRRRASTSGGW